MSGYKDASPISMVNLKIRKASLESQERNREILNETGAQNQDMEFVSPQPNELTRRKHNIKGKKPSKIPVLKNLKQVRIDGSQNPKNAFAGKIPKTEFAADSQKSTTATKTCTFESPNRKETRIDEANNNSSLNSPMPQLEENVLREADSYNEQLTPSSNRVIEANASTHSFNNNAQVGDAIGPQIINNIVGIEHQTTANVVFKKLCIIGICFAITFPSIYCFYIWYINSFPENVEEPRIWVQTYFLDYISNMFQ